MAQPWKTDQFFVSPWCYLPEVTKGFNFPPKIKIHDVTLRDGEQQTAVVFRREEKVAIARQLDALGVQRIEAGMPAVSDQDRAAISEIANLGLKIREAQVQITTLECGIDDYLSIIHAGLTINVGRLDLNIVGPISQVGSIDHERLILNQGRCGIVTV